MKTTFTKPTHVPTVTGYEIVCAKNEFNGDKLTGFTNYRFSVSSANQTVTYTDILGRQWDVRDVAGYHSALRLNIPAMYAICLPLAEYAKRMLSEAQR